MWELAESRRDGWMYADELLEEGERLDGSFSWIFQTLYISQKKVICVLPTARRDVEDITDL